MAIRKQEEDPHSHFDDYTLFDVLGDGPHGIVQRALSEQSGRDLAVKLFHCFTIDSKEELEEFKHSFREILRLHHPNIAAVQARGSHRGQPFVATDYIEGTTCQEMFAGHPADETEVALGMLTEIADAVGYAHSRGVCHHNLKPGNVMVSTSGSTKLVDFEPSNWRFRSRNRAKTEGAEFLAPELHDDDTVAGKEADIFSLGALLCFFQTGAPPRLTGENGRTLTLQARKKLGTMAPVVERALSANPAGRYSSCEEFLEALDEAFGAEPAPGVRPGPEESGEPSKARKRSSRRLYLAGAAGLGFVAAGLLAAGLIWGGIGESSLPVIDRSPLSLGVPLLGIIDLEPGVHDLQHEKTQVGYYSKIEAAPIEQGFVRTRPRTEIRDGSLFVRRGALIADGTCFREVDLTTELHGRVEARECLFDRCNMAKHPGWISSRGYSSKWTLSSCVLAGQAFQAWETRNIGVKLTNCTFYDIEFPALKYAIEPAAEVHVEWRLIKDCRFVRCTVPESVLIATQDCVFEDCVFSTDALLEVGIPFSVDVYLSETATAPPPRENVDYAVRSISEHPRRPGAGVDHRYDGEALTFK